MAYDIGLGVSPQLAAYMQSQLSQPGGGMYGWHTPYLSDASSSGAEGSGGLPDGVPGVDWLPQSIAYNPEWLKSIGFDYGSTDVWGNRAIAEGGGENAGGPSSALLQYLADKGLSLRVRQLPGPNAGQAQYFDAAGNPVGMTVSNTLDPDQEFAIAGKLAMAIMTGGAAAAGLGAMGGTIGSSLGLGSGAVGTAVGNGLLNAGMQSAVGGNVGGALKNSALAAGGAYLGQQAGGLGNSFVEGGGSIEPGFFDSPSAGGGMDFFGGDYGLGDFNFGSGDLGYTFDPNLMPSGGMDFGGMNIYSGGDMSGSGLAGGLWNAYDPSIVGWNAPSDEWTGGLRGTLGDQPGDYDMPTNSPTPGWTNAIDNGLLGSLWGGAKEFLKDKGNSQMLGGLLGALAGASGSGDRQQTSQQRMDPRMEPYVYGQGGLLSGAADWFNRNRGGNPLMNEGAQMQADFYRSPAYTQGFGQLRDRGLSLLGGQIAGNPFMQGAAAPTPQPPQQFAPQPMPQPIPTQQPQGGRMTIMPVRGNYY